MQNPCHSPKEAVLVVGYYRSGTSALSGALADVGVRIGGDAERNPSNPKGFFESTELIKLDVRVLESMGAIWSDLSPLPPGWIERADIQVFREVLGGLLRNHFSDAPLVGLKHPHLCRLLPIYLQALSDIGYAPKVIHTHRSPFSIATSQSKKNNLTRAHAVALWASYITSAEFLCRDLPRTWVQYPDLLDAPDEAVMRALATVGVHISAPQRVSFVTKSLNRSTKVAASGLYPPLADLIADIEGAIFSGADAAVWDELRERSAALGAFVDELGRTGSRAAPGVGQATVFAMPGIEAANLARQGRIHALRPPEHGDDVEWARLAGLLGTARGGAGRLPTVSVMIAVPKGATAAQFKDTVHSLDNSWVPPDVRLSFSVEPQFNVAVGKCTADHVFATGPEMTAALYAAMATANTDYVAIIHAGDRIEPDAIARFILRAAASQADMIYCDQVVNGPSGAWIRTKPAMSLPRLLETCFVGDWVWYRRETVASLGGFRPDFAAGAEEPDLQIRLVESGHSVDAIHEALFVAGPDTHRDEIPIEAAVSNMVRSIDSHFERTGKRAMVASAPQPGMFVVEYDCSNPLPLTIAFLCGPGTDVNIINGMLMKLGQPLQSASPHIAFIRIDGCPEAVLKFLGEIEEKLSASMAEVHVVAAPATLAGTIGAIQAIAPERHVAVVDPISAPSNDDAVAALAAILEAYPDAGAIAPLVFFRDREQAAKLHGPLLFGGLERVGAGLDAASPGPGAWLAATQPVDAVDGPLVVLRAGVTFQQGANSWADICSTLVLGSTKATVLWTPRRQFEIPIPPDDVELRVARGIPYSGENHHPALTVSGDPLRLEGRLGLVEHDHAALLTTTRRASDGRILSAARYAREHAGARASITDEPLDTYSVLRAASQRRPWVRLNPQIVLRHPRDGSAVVADIHVWSFPPAADARDVVLSARRNIATSGRIAARLRGMGARGVSVWSPKPGRHLWTGFTHALPGGKPGAVWVREEGIDVPWLDQLIRQTSERVAWTVVSDVDANFDGKVVRKPVPLFEEDWARLFRAVGAAVMVRPSPGADWCDAYVPLIGLAGGCHVIMGNECPIDATVEPLISARLSSDNVGRWVKAVLSVSENAEREPIRMAMLDLDEPWLDPGSIDWLKGLDEQSRLHDAA